MKNSIILVYASPDKDFVEDTQEGNVGDAQLGFLSLCLEKLP